jgi:hypothetical protein
MISKGIGGRIQDKGLNAKLQGRHEDGLNVDKQRLRVHEGWEDSSSRRNKENQGVDRSIRISEIQISAQQEIKDKTRIESHLLS